MQSFLVLLIVFLINGCSDKPAVRHYTEIIVDEKPALPPMVQAADDPHAGLNMSGAMTQPMPTANAHIKDKLTWTTPQGWEQSAGTTMRLASFKLIKDPTAIDCSIVSLGGMAGGLEANLQRWLGQIKLSISDEQLREFIANAKTLKTTSGLDVQLFDFTTLQKANTDGATPTILAAMLTVDEATVFIKMNASIAVTKEQRNAFESLVRSVRAK